MRATHLAGLAGSVPDMAEFEYQEMFPVGPDTTTYRKLTDQFVSTFDTPEGRFLKVDPAAITLLTETAMRDIAHLLRSDHLQQLANILKDPEASDNDRFVALDLLKNAGIAAGGVLPMCQDTGTAIVKGKKGQFVFTGGGDEEAIARGVYNTYLTSNLRYSQMAALDMYEEKNTGNNLPAEIKIAAVDGDAYKFLFIAKGGGSANKSYLFQETKAILNPKALPAFINDKIKTLGTAACPPYHLAIVVGGTSAEMALETAKLASTHYLDALPTTGNMGGRAFRDIELEKRCSNCRGRRASALSSAESISATTFALCGSRATVQACPSPSRCRARPTARLWERSPPRACFSSNSKPSRPTSCPRSPMITSREMWFRSTSPDQWPRSAPSYRSTP